MATILGKRVALRVLEKDDRVVNGIIMPNSKEDEISKGEVVLRGYYADSAINEGCKVLYEKKGKTSTIDIDGEEFLIISSDDIVAVL